MGAGAHVTERTEPLGWLELPANAPTLSALLRLRRFRIFCSRSAWYACSLVVASSRSRRYRCGPRASRAARSGRPGRARCPGTWSHTSRRGARCGRPSPCSGGRPPAMSVRRSCGVLPLRGVEARTRQAARPATRRVRPLSSRHHPVHQRPPFTQTLVHPSHRRIRDTTDGRCADLPSRPGFTSSPGWTRSALQTGICFRPGQHRDSTTRTRGPRTSRSRTTLGLPSRPAGRKTTGLHGVRPRRQHARCEQQPGRPRGAS